MTQGETVSPKYADAISIVNSTVSRIDRLARETYRIRVVAPCIARRVVPGQFVMIRFTDRDAPLIGRALAVYDVIADRHGLPEAIDLVFVRKGAWTTPMASSPAGTAVSLWGPLGNGFSPRECDTLIMAAGGIGQTPMLLLGREALGGTNHAAGDRPRGWAGRVLLVYGARSADLLAGLDDFAAAGIELDLCTDDGTRGHHGRVPDRLATLLDSGQPFGRVHVACCGPEVMMEKVSEVCAARTIGCQVSMETPMACGIGICFSCVAKIRSDEAGTPWDYRRTCIEGPVFDGRQIVW